MLANSIRTRSARFAYFFGPPRTIARGEASQIFNTVCDALQYDDLAFRYGTEELPGSPTAKAFAINLERTEGGSALQVIVDHQGGTAPLRLFLGYDWPAADVSALFDRTAAAIFERLGGGLAKISAEVRLRAQCNVRDGDALQFMARMFRFPDTWIESLGTPLTMVSAKFETEHSDPHGTPLAGPKRELTIEVLREDARCVYIELMSQWLAIGMDPAGQRLMVARAIDERPSVYLAEADQYLRGRVEGLGTEGR